MPEGGIIVLDDFGFWEGAREGFYDFCEKQGIKPLLERTGPWQAFWRKGYQHNRNIEDVKSAYWPRPVHYQRPFSAIKSTVWPVRD